MENKVTVGARMMGSINFAMQQNYIPVFRNLTLTNTTETELENLLLRITFEPEFARPFETEIPKLAPATPTEISPVRIIVSADYLCSLTEKLVGSVHIEVLSGEETLYSQYEEIELLAYDEWSGLLFIPEIIAAFVTPNHPKVAEVVAKASTFLQKWEGTPSFTGYQTKNPNIAKKQAAAIYAALQTENIAYNMPPASYEIVGQRVRMPGTVLEQKCGTCLDLAVLYAACLEAVGLNPLIVFIKGHAFAGLWLESDTFAECAEDDVTALTKRIADGIDSIYLVECTDFVAGKGVDFDRAGKHAADNLADPFVFNLVVDIARTRGSGIRSMPVRVLENGTFTAVDYGRRDSGDITSAPKEIDMKLHGSTSENKEITRKNIWERKLLDLGLRNSLLNFRPTASNIQFMTADLSILEDEISRGEDFKIMPAPNDFTVTLSDSKIFEIENEKDLITAIAESEFKSRRLRTFIQPAELERTLKKLHRQAKISIEENGANTLYMALGFLRWFETDQSPRPRFAPIVLIPVDIIKKIQDRSYSIRIRDEEIQMNITLLEMLRQDFGINIGGLNPLPCDESGIDLPLIFNTVRQGIMSKKRWDILEFAFLGQFSFSRFIMWNDLRNREEDLKKNKVVSSLVSGKIEWQPENISITPRELDGKIAPCDMAVPTSADSSQLAAIYEAACGQSFVLHGPPGTGKSQTITNMIANALYNGKSVLFVAEKMAALSVVQKRLAAIGLDPFCLELHSNKAQKKAVLSQLEHTLAVGHVKSPTEYNAAAERLHSLRAELNGTMEELYKQRAAGLSVYDAVAMLESVGEFAGIVSLSPEFVDSADSEKFTLWCDAARKTAVAGNELGGFKNSALKNVCLTAYTPEMKEKFVGSAEKLSVLCTDFAQKYAALSAALGTELPHSFDGCTVMMKMLSLVYEAPLLLKNSVTDNGFENKKAELEKIIAAGARRTELYNEFSAAYEQSVWGFDPDAALLRWKQTQQKWFLPKAIGTGKLVREMALYAKNPADVTKETLVGIYEKLSDFKRNKEFLTAAAPQLTAAFGDLWTGESTNFELLKTAYDKTCEIRAFILSGGKFSQQLSETAAAAVDAPDNKKALAEFNAANADYAETCKTLDALMSGFSVNIRAVTGGENWLETAKCEADGWRSDADNLKPRAMLENALDELRSLNLTSAADAYTGEKADEESLVPALRAGVCKAVISSTFGKVPALAKFQGAQFEDTIEKYREAAASFEDLTIQELVSRLSAKIPDSSAGAAGSSEVSVLQKAIRSGGRMLPIRKLFDSIPNLLRRICPCMLMSPISVAQYIDPNFPKFDLVIFDEASQMPTCEAVGAIARGENVVVVGDPKQLPPTSFFASNQVDEENIDKEDLESVLDDCLVLAMPQKHLLWHYRSRHESLIAYSNAKFYDNKLYTFPSPDDLVSEVKWHKVEGFYDKGATKQNKAEAETIVAEIVRRLSDENLRRESIGVVTFSVVQQELIDDMLAEEYRKNPQLEQYANEMYEPILVKNLENVQGDERDIILFSIGYGPDKDGKVSMNFGPLNRDGGWRRLNVAISRARKGMQVYSVITPDQIDTSRTRSDGVAALKGFLEFAARGTNAIAVRVGETKEIDNFEKSVAEAVKSLGYDVRIGVGSSEYKIDIGVVNPENPDTYILGIICESKHLFGATTARDRSILQPKVLAGLGWRVYSVHILDWYDNRKKKVERIKAAIEDAAAHSDEEPAPPTENKPPRTFDFETEEIPTAADKCSDYVPYRPSVQGSAESFYEPSSKAKIVKVIRDAVTAEAPVSRKAVLKYVLASFGISRSGNRVEAVFDDAVSASGIKVSESNGTTFFWRADQYPVEYSDCRISKSGEKRTLDDICAEEIRNGMLLVLGDQISMAKADISRETAKLFGFTRTGGIIESSVNNGMRCAFSGGRAYLDNDRIMLRK